LTRIERSFWTKIQQSRDFRQVSYSIGRLYVPKLNLAVDSVLSICLISFCGQLLGVIGVCISCLICVLLISRYLLGILQDRNQHSQWRLHLMDNATSWTLLTLMLSGIFAVLCSVEAFLPQRLYLAEAPMSMRQAIANAQFRQIEPRAAHFLEDDCARHLRGLAERDFPPSEHSSDADKPAIRAARVRGRMVTYGRVLMVVLCVPFYFFSVRPFGAILKKQQTWALQSTKHTARGGPSTPYLPQAWKWKSTLGLRSLIVLYYILGVIVNFTAAVLCVDSLGYAFLGHSIILNNTANLCSWVFASYKIALGPDMGQIAAAITVTVVSLPLLFLAGAFIRRSLSILVLWLKMLRRHRSSRSHPEVLWLQEYLTEICREYGVKVPTVLLNRRSNVGVRLLHITITNTAAIELSTDTLKLLTRQELEAVMLHEVAHIRQGLWQVSLLKALSCLALFPNFYLTLCLDWAEKEMEADRFAIAVTGDANALKRALVKTTAAQLAYTTRPQDCSRRFWARPIRAFRARCHSIMASLRFFFGDGLLGYAHPYLSERLEAIEHG
jgi:Zn-dependent protease with chaperone function